MKKNRCRFTRLDSDYSKSNPMWFPDTESYMTKKKLKMFWFWKGLKRLFGMFQRKKLFGIRISQTILTVAYWNHANTNGKELIKWELSDSKFGFLGNWVFNSFSVLALNCRIIAHTGNRSRGEVFHLEEQRRGNWQRRWREPRRTWACREPHRPLDLSLRVKLLSLFQGCFGFWTKCFGEFASW